MLQNLSVSRSPDPRHQLSWASRTIILDTPSVSHKNLIKIWYNSLSTRHLKTLFATNMFALSLPSFSLVALLLLCWASVRKQFKLYELLSFTLVCEHRFLSSETSIWSRLTASNAVNRHMCNVAESILQQISVMRTWDVMSFWTIILGTPSVSHNNLITIWYEQPERVSLEHPVCHI